MPQQFDFDEIDVRQKSLFARLKNLFSTDVIVRNVGGKKIRVKDTDNNMLAMDRNSQRDRFNRVRSTSYHAYNRDFSLSYQAARIDLFRDYDCVGPDTIVPLPDGTYPTIAELAEKYKDKPQERFWVYSYDHKTDSIKLGKAYHPRKKSGGARKCWKVIFDNDQYVIGSAGHPFLMRNGEYKKLEDITVGESVMPFYQKLFYPKKHYKFLYNFSKGWQAEHKIVAEQFERPMTSNECVHHKNFDRSNNLPENLQIMDKKEHASYHANLLGDRHGENNPFYGKHHTDESNEKRSKTLKEAFVNRNQSGEKNPKYRDDLTVEVLKVKATEYYKENTKLDIFGFAKFVGCDYSTIQSRLENKDTDWGSFKNEIVSTLNHKIKAIEYVGEMDVYDVTVEHFNNFACDSCFLHNTMDMDPIISAALDIYAEECLTKDEMGKILKITCENNNVKEILENLYGEILNIDFNLWSWIRNMTKYGDFFLRLYISPEYGVYLVEPICAYNVERIQGSDPANKSYVNFQIRPTDTSKIETLENFEMAHFRMLSDSNFLPYGKGMIEGARRVWKQLSLMEDAMLIHRIMRAPEKRIFKLDIGNIPPQDVDSYMERAISKMKKVPYMDPNTGDYNLRFNLQNMVEDFYLPVRGSDSGTSIDTLSGMEFTGTEDIEYLRNKMMAALKIPKAFLGYDESLSGKASLSMEDVRFARTIQRIQKIVCSELEKIGIVHLYAQGYRDEELVSFKLDLTNPSTIFEKEKIEIWDSKTDVASRMMEAKLFPKKWIYKNIFNLSDEDVEGIANDIVEDSKQTWRHKSIEEEGNDPAKPQQKINTSGDTGGGGPGGDEGGLEGALGGGSGSEPDLGAEPGGAPEPGGLPELQETSVTEGHGEHAPGYRRPSQAGQKDASKYPFGEDPLGDKENHEKSKSDRSSVYNPRPVSLTLESGNVKVSSGQKLTLKNLYDNFGKGSTEKKELLKETNGKSILDEANIIEE
jgi:hypothetical protein